MCAPTTLQFLFTLICFLHLNSSWSQSTYYISPTGDDNASGASPSEAWQTLDRLNSQTFTPGEEIRFERGGHWLGMFHLKGSGSQNQPIVVDAFGAPNLPAPILDGDGYQTALLVYNESFITVQNLAFTNQASHLDANGTVKKLSTFLGESNDWGSGKKRQIWHQGCCRLRVDYRNRHPKRIHSKRLSHAGKP